MTTHRSRLACLLAAMVALLIPGPARAQVGMAMNMGDFDGSITRTSLDKYARVLGMDDAQKEMAGTLFEGYRTAYKAIGKEMQEAIQDIGRRAQEDRDWSLYRTEMPEKMKGFTERMEKVRTGFLDDVKALLSEDQKARWPKVERMRRRDEGLRFGFVSGAGVDIVDVAAGALGEAPPPAELPAVLDRYELEMDKALVDLQDAGREQQDKAMDAASNMDMDAMRAMMKKFEDMAKGLRDINQRYARLVRPLLPADAATKFDTEVKRRSYPRVYRETLAEKSLAAAEKFSDLTPEQRETLGSLREQADRELPSARDAWAAAITDRENAEGGMLSGMMQGAMGDGGGGSDGVKDARKAVRDLEDQLLSKLKAALTDAQNERLPTKDDVKQSENGFDVMFGGG
ncbi:MAG: hypothetical protein IT437_05270 [Phycisphaerales bacterium]|nr:hypothetical protein [Phycisphaerales bacterium]